jgi:AcrR family transcriptional regulator
MSKADAKKQIIIEKLADHLLQHGMKESSLRQLAAAADMSDRMLLHYFTNKDELLTATLVHINDRLICILDSTSSEQMPLQILLPHLAQLIKNPLINPYLKLWLELVPLTAAEKEPYLAIVKQICDTFFWKLTSMLKVEHEEDRTTFASLAFAIIEGFVLLDALGFDTHITSALKGIGAARWAVLGRVKND